MNLFFRVKWFFFKEQLRVLRYYRSVRFACVDLAFAFFPNPYRICRKFTGAHSYGETPITTFAQIAKAVELTCVDHFVDFGAGRGKLCFWLALHVGCKCTGIEQIPRFVRQANFLAKRFGISAHFASEADLSDATVVYLYTMEWDETALLQMKPGARLITIGAPVEVGFELIRTLEVTFPWGDTEGYIQVRTEESLPSSVHAKKD